MANFNVHIACALAVAAFIAPTVASADPTTRIETVVVIGAVKDPANALYPKDTSANAAPVLPVVYETKQAAPKDTASK
ncbi:MAG TPA: hypothetical protein VFV07_01280 [Rhizomicrobium sp.]|nr:hypothetical protein [Rhizomicrobium sp.]